MAKQKTETVVTITLTVQTAFGPCGLAYRAKPFAITRIFLPQASANKVKPSPGGGREVAHHKNARAAAQALVDYFDGKTTTIPWHWFDMEQVTPARQKVLRAVFDIAYGTVQSYGSIAQTAGFDGGARFVGNTMANNPFPVFIPCHRVIRADGSLGGFGGGTDLKKRMIEMEHRRRSCAT